MVPQTNMEKPRDGTGGVPLIGARALQTAWADAQAAAANMRADASNKKKQKLAFRRWFPVSTNEAQMKEFALSETPDSLGSFEELCRRGMKLGVGRALGSAHA